MIDILPRERSYSFENQSSLRPWLRLNKRQIVSSKIIRFTIAYIQGYCLRDTFCLCMDIPAWPSTKNHADIRVVKGYFMFSFGRNRAIGQLHSRTLM